MDNQQENNNFEEETTQQEVAYVPRPKWQVWLARILLVLFIALIIMYYINLMRG